MSWTSRSHSIRRRCISKVTDPAEKKTLAYEKDHRSPLEFPHTFRNSWPRKKARANRKYRRQVKQFLTDEAQPMIEGAEISKPPLRRSKIRKWGAMPLREWIADKQEMRLKRTAWNFFKTPYDPASHQERFAVFLTTITQGRTDASRALARHFDELLAPPDLGKSPFRHVPIATLPREWLTAFLADTPEWDQRLRAWIEEMRAYGES